MMQQGRCEDSEGSETERKKTMVPLANAAREPIVSGTVESTGGQIWRPHPSAFSARFTGLMSAAGIDIFGPCRSKSALVERESGNKKVEDI